MSDLADYLGRTVDVVAWRGVTASGEMLLTPSLVDEDSTGELTTGVHKLAQRFLIELLTELGTVAHFPNLGTTLMTDLQSGKARTTADLFAIFAIAERQARLNLLAEDTEDMPADERYKAATLSGVVLSPGNVSLSIQLESLADTAKIILPIQIAL